MPIFSEHERQADSNIQFVCDLTNLQDVNGSIKYPDWIVTGCFYIAVHAIEAMIFALPLVHFYRNNSAISDKDIKHSKDLAKYFSTKDKPVSTHYLRSVILTASQNGFSDDFVNAYKTLEEKSHESRYNCYAKCSKLVMKCKKQANVIIKEYNSKNTQSTLKPFII